MPQKETDLKEAAGRRLAQIVEYSGLSKGEFARFLGLPHQSGLSNWLSGGAMPPIESMLRVKRRWKISLDWIYDGDGGGQTQTITRELEAIVLPDGPAPRGRPQLRVVGPPAKAKRRKAV